MLFRWRLIFPWLWLCRASCSPGWWPGAPCHLSGSPQAPWDSLWPPETCPENPSPWAYLRVPLQCVTSGGDCILRDYNWLWILTDVLNVTGLAWIFRGFKLLYVVWEGRVVVGLLRPADSLPAGLGQFIHVGSCAGSTLLGNTNQGRRVTSALSFSLLRHSAQLRLTPLPSGWNLEQSETLWVACFLASCILKSIPPSPKSLPKPQAPLRPLTLAGCCTVSHTPSGDQKTCRRSSGRALGPSSPHPSTRGHTRASQQLRGGERKEKKL